MSTAITAADLACVRSTLEDTLTESATIRRLTDTADGAGGQSRTYADVATVPARIAPVTGREAITGARLTSINQYKITMPAGTDIQESDRVVIGAHTFEAVAVLIRTNEISRRVLAAKVE